MNIKSIKDIIDREYTNIIHFNAFEMSEKL
jgi:hypothetical protein